MGAAFPYIVVSFTWRHAWYFLGAGALVMAAVNGLFLRSAPETNGYRPWGEKDPATGVMTAAAREQEDYTVKNIFLDRNFWIIGASYLCISYSLYGITTFMVDYARDQVGLPLEQASFLATIHGVCQVVGVLTILPLSDAMGRKRTILLSNFFITLALVGIIHFGDSRLTLYGLIGVFAVFYGVTFPIYGACAGDYFPRRFMGTVIGAWTPFYGLGAILVHWITGYLRDVNGTYTDAFFITGAMAAVGFLLFFLVRKEGR
jgi:sugar phosphate permease